MSSLLSLWMPLCISGPAGSNPCPLAPGIPIPMARKVEVRGVWIHTYRPTDWEEVAGKVAAHGLNSLFVRVGRGGNVIYKSDLLPQEPWAEEAGVDELQRAVEAAHRHGLDLHAWRVNFHLGSAPPWYQDRMREEGRLSIDVHGRWPENRRHWFANPGDPRNTELEYQAMIEILEKYAVDGIHFDYIRYTEVPSYDFDYSPASRAAFERTLQQDAEPWPDVVAWGPLKVKYENWERDNISRLVERVYREAKRRKPWVKVSAAVWRNHRRFWGYIKQDWPRWVREGWLDFVVPMDYTPDGDTFRRTVESQVAVVAGQMPLVVGIGSWLLKEPEQLLEQVEITRLAGADGFVLFAYNAEQIGEQLAALHAGPTAEPAVPAYRAPEITFALGGATPRKDEPYFARQGDTVTLVGLIRPGCPYPEKIDSLEAKLTLENLDGQVLAELGTLESGRTFNVPWGLPRGPSRPVVRGVLRTASGAEYPFLRRGPVLEGLPAEEARKLWRRESPPRVEGPGVRVAVYAGGYGAAGVYETLRGIPGLQVFYLYQLRPHHLSVAEVLVLTQERDVAEIHETAIQWLREWVEQGGRLMGLHDAVGLRTHPSLFPEIGHGKERVENRLITLTQDLPGLPSGKTIEHAFYDHHTLALTDAATVLAQDENGDPVIAVGEFGRGSVILNGTLPSSNGPPEGDERILWVELIRQLAGKTLTGKPSLPEDIPEQEGPFPRWPKSGTP